MFSSIVVGTDGSTTARAAVEKAAELARLAGGRLHVVSAYKLPSQAMALAPVAEGIVGPSPALDRDVAADVEQSLKSLAGELRRDGVQVETYACPQGPVQALLDVAAHQEADVIVVGNRGMHGARRLLGSVPSAIAHRATCTVMIVAST